MDLVLKEQGFQQTGACSDEACLVEMGQLMGVQRMVAGSLGKLGTMYTLSIRLINVESGEILATANEDCDCDVKVLLSQTMPALAAKMAQASGFQTPPVPVAAPAPASKKSPGGYPKNKNLGLVMLGTGLVAGVLAAVFFSSANSQYDAEYMAYNDVSSSSYQTQIDDRYSAYQSKMILTWICVGGAASALPASAYFLLAKTPGQKGGAGK
jgi:hypothetical protein